MLLLRGSGRIRRRALLRSKDVCDEKQTEKQNCATRYHEGGEDEAKHRESKFLRAFRAWLFALVSNGSSRSEAPRAAPPLNTPAPVVNELMIDDEGDLEFVRHACAELALSLTNPRDHNLHAALNGLVQAVEANRARIHELEVELERIRGEAPALPFQPERESGRGAVQSATASSHKASVEGKSKTGMKRGARSAAQPRPKSNLSKETRSPRRKQTSSGSVVETIVRTLTGR